MAPIVAIMAALNPAHAGLRFELMHDQVEVVGELRTDFGRRDLTLMDIGRWNSMGYHEIRRANPDINLWNPGEGRAILIPALFVLPDGAREGMLVNRAEKRLYYFHRDAAGRPVVTTYPIGVGIEGRETPSGARARIVRKLESPAWYPTAGVIANYKERGLYLPRRIPPGPDNPLGDHVLMLDLPGIMLHGTNRPDGVGMRVSQGCVRLFPEHIRYLVETVPLGTSVQFVDQPIKLGQRDGKVYLEVHPDADGRAPTLAEVIDEIDRWRSANRGRAGLLLDMDKVATVADAATGVPEVVSGETDQAGLVSQAH